MAVVHLARDFKHDRQVALKVLRPEIAASVGHELVDERLGEAVGDVPERGLRYELQESGPGMVSGQDNWTRRHETPR